MGILPDDFLFLSPEMRLFIPAAFTEEEKSDDSRHSNNWEMVGRLAPGATLEQAQSQIDALNAANLERFPEAREIVDQRRFSYHRHPAARTTSCATSPERSTCSGAVSPPCSSSRW